MTKPTRAELAAAVKEYMRKLAAKAAPLGGKARAAKLSAERRQEIAIAAIKARWAKVRKSKKTRPT